MSEKKKHVFYVSPSISVGNASALGIAIIKSLAAGNSVEVEFGENKIHGTDIVAIFFDDPVGKI